MNRFRLFALLAIIAASGAAQTTIFPGGMTGSGGNAIPFQASFANDIRYQLFIPAAQMGGSPAVISDVQFLATGTAATGAVTMPLFELSLGAAPGPLTCNLAANAPAQQVQFSGAHTYTYTPGVFSSLGIPIAYFYDGVSDLLIELRIQGSTGGGAFDTAQNSITRVYNRLAGGFNATTCSHQPSAGIAVGLVLQPLMVPFTLSALTLGGGIGNLDLTIAGIPASTVEGWTLFSTDTSVALGAGPIFGLKLDQNTITLVGAFPFPLPGNPVHWTYPAPGLFPDVPAIFPAGTFSALAGLSVDFLAVAIGGGGSITAAPVNRVTF